MIEIQSREEWLTLAVQFILDDIFRPVVTVRDTLEVRVGMGFIPDTKTTGRIEGACLPSHRSEGDYNEIYIVPMLNDSLRVLTVLCHELVHAIDNCENKHGKPFRDIAREVGMIAPFTEAHASIDLTRDLNDIIAILGPIPHSKVKPSPPKQQGRSLPVRCSDPECGFKFNASRTQINRAIEANDGDLPCLVCCGSMSVPD